MIYKVRNNLTENREYKETERISSEVLYFVFNTQSPYKWDIKTKTGILFV